MTNYVNVLLKIVNIFFYNDGFILESEEIDVATTLPNNVKEILKKANATDVKSILNTRRIMVGSEAMTNRPYMVSKIKITRSTRNLKLSKHYFI